MIFDKVVGGEPPAGTPEKIGAALGDVVSLAIYAMMVWVVYKAFF